ncbi:MAG: response regulator transcription factor [Marinilabiliaceae bacterium]|nr:response regulator transcription factor [Marinilabiliaceae bacterium]
MKLIQLKDKKKVAIKTNNNIKIIDLDEILFIEGMNTYSKLVIAYKKSSIVSLNLKSLENLLLPLNFVRCHKRYLVNLTHISEICNKTGCILELDSTHKLPASREGLKRVKKALGI